MSDNDTFSDLIPGADVGPRPGGPRRPQTRRRSTRGEDAPSPLPKTPTRVAVRDDTVTPAPKRQPPAEAPEAKGAEETRGGEGAPIVEPADALAAFLRTNAGAKTTSKSFFLPPDRAKALQLMRQELIDQGFSPREASMSNMVAAMIDQWHETIFGRPIGG